MSGRAPGVLLKTSFTIHLKITLGIIIGVLTIAVVTTYIMLPSVQDELKFVVAVIGGGAAVYTGYYVAATLRASIASTKKRNAFEILRDLNNPELIRFRDMIDHKIETEKVAPDDLYQMIRKDEHLRHAVTTQLDLFEDMAIAASQDYADEDMLYSSLMRIAPQLYDRLEYYISKERERNNSKVMYIEFQKLTEAWARNNSFRTGKKLSYTHPEG